MAKKFLLQWALANLWKKQVFISPCFNQASQDFYLHEISSNRTHFLYSPTPSRVSTSSRDKIQDLSFVSQKVACSIALAFLTSSWPKPSPFQVFILNFNALHFAAKIKLEEPWKLNPSHQDFSKSLNPSFNHIFKPKRRRPSPQPFPIQQNRKVIRHRSRKHTLHHSVEMIFPPLK